jgi:hypothetical protein
MDAAGASMSSRWSLHRAVVDDDDDDDDVCVGVVTVTQAEATTIGP